ncbi:low affinity iron permease family protein [Taklimakanibacter deserti]|uniref:low affinity iron permease family protein n=1 Tax=Taklimakanibacter deserti TaxID=2267839 RepID=UPI000E65A10C
MAKHEQQSTGSKEIDARFAKVTSWVARQAGNPVAFALAACLIIAWAAAGPFLGYSDMWQLTVNTATTIITFLMVFIIQNSQNRDTEALQIKIDELIRASRGAENALLDLENLPQNSLDEFRDHYRKLAEHARAKGFDLAAVIAGMEAEKELLKAQRRTGKPDQKTRKRKLSLAVKGT